MRMSISRVDEQQARGDYLYAATLYLIAAAPLSTSLYHIPLPVILHLLLLEHLRPLHLHGRAAAVNKLLVDFRFCEISCPCVSHPCLLVARSCIDGELASYITEPGHGC